MILMRPNRLMCPNRLVKLLEEMKRESKPTIPLGRIVRDWKVDVRDWTDNQELTLTQRRLYKKNIARLYQNAFQKRPDYQLYIRLRHNLLNMWWDSVRLNSLTNAVEQFGHAALDSPYPVVVWGGLSVIAWQMASQLSFTLDSCKKAYNGFKRKSQQTGHDHYLVVAVQKHLKSCPPCKTDSDAIRHLYNGYDNWLGHHRKELLGLSDAIESRLDQSRRGELDVNAPAQCAFIRLLAKSGIEKLHFDTRCVAHNTVDDVNRYLNRLEDELCNQLQWQPGDSFDCDILSSEFSANAVMPWNPFMARTQIDDVFYRARGTAYSFVRSNWDSGTAMLMKRVAPWMYSSWRCCRSILLEERLRGQEDPAWRHDQRPLVLEADEAKKLQRAGQAMKDAGDHLGAAAHAHLLLRTISDNLIDSENYAKAFRRLATDVGHDIRQAGFEFDDRDDRFERPALPRYSGRVDEVGEPTVDVLEDESSQHVEDDAAKSQAQPADAGQQIDDGLFDMDDPYRLRLTYDQNEHPDLSHHWRKVLAVPSFRRQRDQLSAAVAYVKSADVGDHHRCELLRSLYLLSLHYGHLDAAATLLSKFVPDDHTVPSEVVSFAREVKRASQIIPFGIDLSAYRRWQDNLRHALGVLPREEWLGLGSANLLAVHESMIGCGLTIIQNSPRLKRLMASKFTGRMTDADARQVFEERPEIFRAGSATIAPSRLIKAIKNLSCGTFGSPTCLSLVQLTEGEFGLLVADRNGVRSPERPRKLGDVDKAAKKLCRQLPENIRNRRGIPWSGPLRGLGKLIVDTVLNLNTTSRWIVLAVEPQLAAIPWQDIVNFYASSRNATLLVSLVPSFSWLEREANAVPVDDAQFRADITPVLSTFEELLAPYENLNGHAPSDGKKIQDEMRTLHSDILAYCDGGSISAIWRSLALVLGHGAYDESERFPTIVADGGTISRERWMDLAERHSIVLVHSCFGGQVEHEMLGDLSGIPGLSLALGCRLVCAPISEAPPEAALTLHRRLISPTGPTTFGERYTDAVRENGLVALYNLYGLPNESVRV